MHSIAQVEDTDADALSRGRIALRDGALTMTAHFRFSVLPPTIGAKAAEKAMIPAIHEG